MQPGEEVNIPIVEELTKDSYESAEEKEDDEGEITAYSIEINGVEYLIDETNNVYDKDSYTILGVYNEESKTIQ